MQTRPLKQQPAAKAIKPEASSATSPLGVVAAPAAAGAHELNCNSELSSPLPLGQPASPEPFWPTDGQSEMSPMLPELMDLLPHELNDLLPFPSHHSLEACMAPPTAADIRALTAALWENTRQLQRCNEP